MTLKNYCFCYSLDVGVTLIGFLHLNAALYFWACVSTFEPIYMWVYMVIAAMYTIRATYFFLMLNNNASIPSRRDYFEWNKWTTFGLTACGLTMITLKWLEWSHIPTWTVVSWTLVGLFNYYHWFIIKDFAGIVDSFSSKVELTPVETAKTTREEATAFIIGNKMD